jgi:5-formyltetrahydrofolate cyclo-ligase
VGIGYDEQEVEGIPADDHDQLMDVVVTDQRTLWFNNAVSGN